jgi:hypothetical protein
MVRWLKILLINFTFFLILFSISLYLVVKNPALLSGPKNRIVTTIDQPNYKIKDVPPEYISKINPALTAYSGKDHDNESKYPLGYFNKKATRDQNFNVVARVKNTDLIVYNVNYRFDQTYLRHVENQEFKKSTQRFILNAGCSVTFGEGLDQGFDYPSQLAKKMDNNWRVYNYGYHGSGPNFIIHHLQKKIFDLATLNEESGVYTWLFVPEHLQRYFCNSTCYNANQKWILSLPEIEFKDGEFFAKDRFQNSEKIQRILMKKMSDLQFFDSNPIPDLKYTEAQLYEFAKAIDYIPSQMNKKIKKKIFLHYNDNEYSIFDPVLQNELIKLNYLVIDLRPYFKGLPKHQLFIQGDGHFSAAANWIVSDVIQQSINESTVF